MDDEGFVPLTAEEAAVWRAQHPQLSLWKAWLLQLAAGVLVAGGVWGVSGRTAAVSATYGVLAVLFPAALFLRGTVSRPAPDSGAALLNLFLWELVKIAMTIGLLVLAPRWIEGLSWPAMLIGLVVAIKVYWLALMWLSPRSGQVGSTVASASVARHHDK